MQFIAGLRENGGGGGVAPTFDNGFYGAHSPRAGARNYRSYILRDEITWNRNPPTPPKSNMKSREEKNAPFSILDSGGGGGRRGGLSVPFKKPEIVVLHTHTF